MHRKIKIWHFVFTVSAVIIILRFHLIINSVALLVSFIGLSFSNSIIALRHFNFALVDCLISGLLILFLPLISIMFREKIGIFSRLNFSSLL
jgi:hypothetical protein